VNGLIICIKKKDENNIIKKELNFMEFYSEFSKNYDKIFPLNQKKFDLLDRYFKNFKEKRSDLKLLDVGCGTGNYAIALAKKGYNIKAVDIDKEMVSLAETKIKEEKVNIDIFRMGMMNIKEKFKKNSFDGIYIIGNVLVHLKRDEIKGFLNLTAELLKDNGKIFIQIVNYNRILNLNLGGLPTIYSEDESVRFERNYEYDQKENIIYFKTKLINNSNNEILTQNKIKLYPLVKSELENFLESSGFKIENIYGNPEEEYQKLSSIPLILTGSYLIS